MGLAQAGSPWGFTLLRRLPAPGCTRLPRVLQCSSDHLCDMRGARGSPGHGQSGGPSSKPHLSRHSPLLQPLSVLLPQEVMALQGLLREFLSTRCVRDMQALESLVGHLVHATKVCPMPSPFQVLRGCRPGQPRRLNVATRADLAWWHSLLSSWPGISTHQFLVLGQPDRHLYTDTLGSWGFGAWSLPAWLQVPWPTGHCLSSIALKELVPVVLAATVWAERWGGQLILCHSDNTAVVAQLNSLHACDPLACNMLRCLILAGPS